MMLIDRSILARVMSIVAVERSVLALRLGKLSTIGCTSVGLILEDITKDINGLVEILFRGRHELWRKVIRDSITVET
jgi:hypothetical protein